MATDMRRGQRRPKIFSLCDVDSITDVNEYGILSLIIYTHILSLFIKITYQKTNKGNYLINY